MQLNSALDKSQRQSTTYPVNDDSSNAPIWNQTCSFDVGLWSTDLCLTVCTKKEHLGTCRIPIQFFREFLDDEARHITMPLISNDSNVGKLDLRVHWSAVDDSITGGQVTVKDSDHHRHSDELTAPSLAEEHHFFRQVLTHVNNSGHYEVVHKVKLWEMLMIILVRKVDLPYISDKQQKSIKTQLGGISGYKGGIACCFNYRNTRLCFVGTHLPAHEGEAHRKDRNNTVEKIQSSCRVGNKDLDLSNQFDHIFWCGDLNYRIDLKAFDGIKRSHDEKVDIVKGLLRAQDWDALYVRDELQREQAAGQVFSGWRNARPNFPPTFKIKQHEPLIYNTKRVPSYCDRVLWRSAPGVCDCP